MGTKLEGQDMTLREIQTEKITHTHVRAQFKLLKLKDKKKKS